MCSFDISIKPTGSWADRYPSSRRLQRHQRTTKKDHHAYKNNIQWKWTTLEIWAFPFMSTKVGTLWILYSCEVSARISTSILTKAIEGYLRARFWKTGEIALQGGLRGKCQQNLQNKNSYHHEAVKYRIFLLSTFIKFWNSSSPDNRW